MANFYLCDLFFYRSDADGVGEEKKQLSKHKTITPKQNSNADLHDQTSNNSREFINTFCSFVVWILFFYRLLQSMVDKNYFFA